MYSRGDLGVPHIENIPVMSFYELKNIINKQYPGYRDKPCLICLAKISVGGSMGFGTFGRALSNNASAYLNGNDGSDKEVIVSTPMYDNDVKLPS